MFSKRTLATPRPLALILALLLLAAFSRLPASAQAAQKSSPAGATVPVSATVAVPASPTAPSPDGDTVLLGNILQTPGKTPEFRSSGQTWRLSARSPYILKTLADKRIADRHFRLEGKKQSNGTFEIDRFYTIHHNELYKVRFYCDTCHITYMQPGRCVCCQGDTELKEIPATDTDE